MFTSSKIQGLQKFLSQKLKSSSKQIPYNFQNNKILPNSYNDRFSLNNKMNTKDLNNNFSKDIVSLKKPNSIDKNCYNNINLLSNFIQTSENTNTNKNNSIKFDSINNSKDPNKSTLSNASGNQNINNINNINITITKNTPKYDKSLFLHTMKYFTINAKNTPIKLEDLNNFFMPINNFLTKNNQKNKIPDNKSYIGVDENFNLTFGKSNNKIEMNTSNNNNTSKPKTKSCDTMKQKFIPLNKKIKLNNILNNISIMKINSIKKNDTSQAKTDRNNRASLGYEKKSEKIENNKIINKINNNLSYGSISQNKEEMNQSKTSYQFRPRNMNLPKNTGIDLESLKLNNQLMQNIILNKKNSLNNSKNYYNNNISKECKNNGAEVIHNKNSIEKNNEKNDENKNTKNNNNFNKMLSMNIVNINKILSQKKNNNKLNFNHFNRDYSAKKKKY